MRNVIRYNGNLALEILLLQLQRRGLVVSHGKTRREGTGANEMSRTGLARGEVKNLL